MEGCEVGRIDCCGGGSLWVSGPTFVLRGRGRPNGRLKCGALIGADCGRSTAACYSRSNVPMIRDICTYPSTHLQASLIPSTFPGCVACKAHFVSEL